MKKSLYIVKSFIAAVDLLVLNIVVIVIVVVVVVATTLEGSYQVQFKPRASALADSDR